MLQRITSFIHQQGAVAGIQLAHAGRKASCARPWNGGRQIAEKDGGWTTVAPSSISHYPEDSVPGELNTDGINKVINDFKVAALRATKAGYKLLEIHAAHGYLIHQFLSPLSNHRTDNYGGSFENRTRLLLEIVKAVQKVWPMNLPLFVRISATDWAENGWNIEESVQLSSILKLNGVDLIDCSAGGLVSGVNIPVGPGFMVPYAKRIRKEAKILTGAVGLITEARQAENILNNEEADIILMARESLRNPYFSLHAATVLGDEIAWPLQYIRAKI
jgi:2,4-dienoyl-CoA reductase-like NADH-dependent reductase (Old Yellow Enzyme family)